MFYQMLFDPEKNKDLTKLGNEPDVIWIKNLERGNHMMVTKNSNYHNVLNFNNQKPYSENDTGILRNEYEPSSDKSIITCFSCAEKYFDCYTYSGENFRSKSIPHRLKREPSLLMVKNTSQETDWIVWHRSFGIHGYMSLNSDEPLQIGKRMFADSRQNNKALVVGRLPETNMEGSDFLALLFTDGENFFSGSYEGGNAKTITTRNRPDLLVIKRKDKSGTWRIFSSLFGPGDSLRMNSHGPMLRNDDLLRVDITETGFEIPFESPALNESGGEYFWFAFAASDH